MDPELEYPFPEAPEFGQVAVIDDDVRWIRLPLPYELDHINLWLIADGDGWTLVDTGFSTSAVRGMWEEIFASALEGRPINRLIVTHFHPDHSGLASWLVDRLGIELWMPRSEWLFGRMMGLDEPGASETTVQFYRRAGVDEDSLDQLRTVETRDWAPLPNTHRRICDGETIIIGPYGWKVIVGSGHSPEHACLFCPELGIIIGGDHLLAKITPNIGVYVSEPEADPLDEYLTSFAKFEHIPADTLVLPSHLLPYRGLPHRLASLKRHHEDRLAVLRDACIKPQTATELVPAMFSRRLDSMNLYLAIGETLSHLNYLRGRGLVSREARGDGVDLYRLNGN
ncbi:MAG: MBL fold metallo-hydrolase [Rhodospirillaceae bacterium]|nr:MBL fold metallo-hydrolase [Rhodospirillaceae bacterium]